MAEQSPYKVSMKDLDAVHVRPEDMVTEHDVTPPAPDSKGPDQREREMILRIAAG